MSDWEELEPQNKPPSAALAPVRFGMRQIRSAPARGVLLIRGDVLAELCGGKAARFKVRLGRGAHSHQLMIVRADDGNFEAGQVGRAMSEDKGPGVWRIILPPVERLPDRKMVADEVKYEIKRGVSMTVDLPAWAWRDRAIRPRNAA